MFSAKNFTEIYNTHVDRIYRFVFIRVNSIEIAQDLTSEVFTRTFEYLEKNRAMNIENIQAFLFRIASNLVTDYYRQKSHKNIPLEYETKAVVEQKAPEDLRPDVAILRAEQADQVQVALQNINSAYADTLMLHYIEDLSIKEIAEITGRPEGTIRVMLHRGLKELRAKL